MQPLFSSIPKCFFLWFFYKPGLFVYFPLGLETGGRLGSDMLVANGDRSEGKLSWRTFWEKMILVYLVLGPIALRHRVTQCWWALTLACPGSYCRNLATLVFLTYFPFPSPLVLPDDLGRPLCLCCNVLIWWLWRRHDGCVWMAQRPPRRTQNYLHHYHWPA